MPRSLVIGNGSLLATFDDTLQLRDIYYPYVGMEDHTEYGDVHRTGVWVDGRFSWFSDDSWERSVRYAVETLVGRSMLLNRNLGITILAEDFVHPVFPILCRHFTVSGEGEKEREVRFFFNHDFHIYGDKQKDTAFYEPSTNSVIHYRQNRYFLIGGSTDRPMQCQTGRNVDMYASIVHTSEPLRSCGLSSYSIGKAEYQGLEGTWRDAEDGELAGSTVEQGSVDSTVGIHARLTPDQPTQIWLWVCFGKSLDDVVNIQQNILRESPDQFQRNCQNYWKSWVNKKKDDSGSLDGNLIDLYKRSLLITRLHCDDRGGIVAAADADIMAFNRDTYTYVWPRDGAFVCLALDHARYLEVTRRFFDFCCRAQAPDGYLLHKYNPDGTVGSTWHPWFRDGEAQLPIQEDETALVLYALWKHFERNQDFEFLQTMYERFLKKAAQFLCNYRDDATGLPLPSYDPWEEHRGVFSYTTACVIAGLNAAARVSHILGHLTHSKQYQIAADEVQQAFLFHLYNEERGHFLKRLNDPTLDASLMHIWKLGVLSPDDPRIVSTVSKLEEALRVRTGIGGYARYPNDRYHALVGPNEEVPGNPWIITTLWFAQWHIARAKSRSELEPARELLHWTERHASSSGILPEQLHPITGKHLSVAPLTWSHATYVETILQFLEKEKILASGK